MFLGLRYKLSILFESIGILIPASSFPKGPCVEERGASFMKYPDSNILLLLHVIEGTC